MLHRSQPRRYLLTLIIATQLQSCGKQESEQRPDAVAWDTASQLPSIDSMPAKAREESPDISDSEALSGQRLFYSSSIGSVKVACANCHADGTRATSDDRIRAGAPLAGVTSRPSTWNGLVTGARLAASSYGAAICVALYQKNSPYDGKPLSADDAAGLNAYLRHIGNEKGAVRSSVRFDWVTNPAISSKDERDEQALTANAKQILRLPGDGKRGRGLFVRACADCHSLRSTGIGPALDYAALDPQSLVRTIRGGWKAMPLFAKGKLSDEAVADIVAYIQQEMEQQ